MAVIYFMRENVLNGYSTNWPVRWKIHGTKVQSAVSRMVLVLLTARRDADLKFIKTPSRLCRHIPHFQHQIPRRTMRMRSSLCGR